MKSTPIKEPRASLHVLIVPSATNVSLLKAQTSLFVLQVASVILLELLLAHVLKVPMDLPLVLLRVYLAILVATADLLALPVPPTLAMLDTCAFKDQLRKPLMMEALEKLVPKATIVQEALLKRYHVLLEHMELLLDSRVRVSVHRVQWEDTVLSME